MIEITARTITTGVAHRLASGNRPRQNRIIPKVPILSITPTIMVAPPGLDCSAASGSQVCSGTSGALIANANMKPTNSQRPVPVPMSQLAQVATAGSWRSPAWADSTYSPITEASMTKPPSRPKIKNLLAAYARRAPARSRRSGSTSGSG